AAFAVRLGPLTEPPAQGEQIMVCTAARVRVRARHRVASIAATETRFAVVAIAIAVLLAATGGRARAQSAEAEALFSDGDRPMTAGKLAEACDAFEASNRIEARAGTLIRLGECRAKNNQLAS